jgi:hypothetical protein
MSSDVRKECTTTIANADEKLLAELGYKQEFQREFTPLEVYYVIISYITLPVNFDRCSGSRLVSLDSCPQSRQSIPSCSFTTLFTIRLQLSLILLRS